MNKIILASASPRRRELMTMVGAAFEVITADCDENIEGKLTPAEYVSELALRKAKSVLDKCGSPNNMIVIGADTIVCLDGKILGKPKDMADAVNTLLMLSGREHSVFTGLAVVDNSKSVADVTQTRVKFTELTREECERYVATGEPLDKAGSYGIQGIGGMFVERIDGDYFNVVGLPISRLRKLLAEQFDTALI
ncbi:MAG: septum formation inhibitor Maf [Clostridiales bacterium]|nr:septum formation inhibitor Maf [Clostridiales bacterium]